MGRKHRRARGRKDNIATAKQSGKPSASGRWRFFTYMSAFFFLAALLVRLDVITAWPGAEGFALGRTVAPEWAGYLPIGLNRLLLPLGEGLGDDPDTIFFFPRLISALCLIATAVFSYRWTRRLFGRRTAELGLLCAGASLFLPFFGKVATADAWALLGQSGMFWTVLLYTLGEDRTKLPAFACFSLVAAVAAPVSTLLLAMALVVLTVFQRTEYSWQLPAGIAAGLACVVLVVQGPQGAGTYWFYGQEDSRVLDLLYYGLLGMLPLAGWLVAGIRDLIYKARKFEPFSMILGIALVVTLLAQSLLFMFLLAYVTGKQMQLYFHEPRYPWKDYVKSVSVLHLVLAFIAAFLALAGGAVAFPGEGFRAALGMAAAYWIFSLLAVLGIFGERRDFAIGGSILSGLLTVLFFWVQVYPYLEAERAWPNELLARTRVPVSTVMLPDEAVESELSTALPYFIGAGWEVAEEGAYRLERSSPLDSTERGKVTGRVIIRQSGFVLKPTAPPDRGR